MTHTTPEHSPTGPGRDLVRLVFAERCSFELCVFAPDAATARRYVQSLVLANMLETSVQEVVPDFDQPPVGVSYRIGDTP